jgi:hypothetical protein
MHCVVEKAVVRGPIADFFLPMVSPAADTPAAGPEAFLPESVYEFAPVVEGTAVTHEFILHNRGDAPLKILKLDSG